MSCSTDSLDERVARALAAAQAEGRQTLLEPEALHLAEALGIRVPFTRLIHNPDEARHLDLVAFPGDRVVVKVVSSDILHKSDVGGVRVVEKSRDAIAAAIAAMQQLLAPATEDAPNEASKTASKRALAWLVCEFVPHGQAPGEQLLLGMRWTQDFGPVVSLGFGGIEAEHLARNIVPGRDVAILSPFLDQSRGSSDPLTNPSGSLTSRPGLSIRPNGSHTDAAETSIARSNRVEWKHAPITTEATSTSDPTGLRKPTGHLARALEGKAFMPLITGGLRNQKAKLPQAELEALLRRCMELAQRSIPSDLLEFEINPLVLTESGPVALDALARAGNGHPAIPTHKAKRPLHKLAHLLQPRSIGIIGVSEKMNVGHIILKNILEGGFDPERVFVVKPKAERIEGCRCVPDLASLPEPVDLFVVSVDAAQVPGLVEEVVERQCAESLVLIPGGLGEGTSTSEGSSPMDRIRDVVRRSRRTDWGGPLLSGPNCLGIRSLPGRYDTLFIPRHKLHFPEGKPTPVALISQSGAFAVARASNLPWLDPRYIVTFGNQVDLTLADYLHFLKNDPDVHVFACYLEGFMPGDGLAWLEAASEITAGGRPVILYRAGRTSAGAQAAASHTASVAGDYAATRELAQAAGVLVADTPEDFDDLLRLTCLLRNKEVRGMRMGALSNAGFECVAIADHAAGFTLPPFAESTRQTLSAMLAQRKLETIGNVRNPMDVTPILDDAVYEEMARTILADPNVDVGVIGCVPLTGALNTLAASSEHREDITREGSLPLRLAHLHEQSTKAWVSVVDSGPLYDPMACLMEAHSIPTFRTADRALELLSVYCRWRSAKSLAS